mgnify:FL=1|jgi:hypothetical protein
MAFDAEAYNESVRRGHAKPIPNPSMGSARTGGKRVPVFLRVDTIDDEHYNQGKSVYLNMELSSRSGEKFLGRGAWADLRLVDAGDCCLFEYEKVETVEDFMLWGKKTIFYGMMVVQNVGKKA